MTHNPSQLLDVDQLRGLIARTELSDQRKEYLNARWLSYVIWWDMRSREAKWKYHGLRAIVIVGGAALPALIALQEITDDDVLAKVLAILVSAGVAIAAGIEELFQYGRIWREKRKAGELLKSAGFSFLQSSGPYSGKNHEGSYEEFANAVEGHIRSEIGEYVRIVEPGKGG